MATADQRVAERLEVDANGLTFSAWSAGAPGGRPVILLHGFPETAWCWRPVMADLAGAGCWAFAPDQRGYSAKARPFALEQYAVPHLVKDVIALADTLEMATFDLIGHDWGGMVAWVLAANHPQRVRSLTVLSTPHPEAMRLAMARRGEDFLAHVERFRRPEEPERLFLGGDLDGSGLRRLFASTGLPDFDPSEYLAILTQPGALTAALNWYRAMDADQLGPLPAITTPTLYVWSTGDVALERSAAEDTARCVAGPFRFEVLVGVSHWIPEEAPGEVSRLVLEHLAGT